MSTEARGERSRIAVEAEMAMLGVDETQSFEATGNTLTDALQRCRVQALRSDAFETEDIREIRVVAGSFERLNESDPRAD